MTIAEKIRATVREDDALRTASMIPMPEGASIPEIRFLPGPITGRLSSSEGAAVVTNDYEGWWF